MPDRLRSTDRLMQAARQLFLSQGITATTTRQIAELAGVNEVTLFRQFSNKQGLLLAVLKDAEVFTYLGEALGRQAQQATNLAEGLQRYAQLHLQAIEQAPEFVRSLIGEAGHYAPETAEALGQTLQQINRYTTEYLATVLADQPPPSLPIETSAALFNSALLGYAVLEVTTPLHSGWQNHTEFLDQLVTLFQAALVQPSLPQSRLPQLPRAVADLPDATVHSLLQHAKKPVPKTTPLPTSYLPQA
ncbi:MAG: TetR/AcrR family transcriptional regulator [Leptolyngbyaceae cyanobacterium SL_7_1]|nr:TetR/AcrR family transcriptional regulator [Leptolyngbyaceae cyanobacterium SL_7_1]